MATPKEVTSFFKTASDYCDWVESPNLNLKDLHKPMSMLSKLYQQALILPSVEPINVEPADFIDKTLSADIYTKLSQLPFVCYYDVFDPVSDEPQEALTADLADDLRDIYIDLKNGLILYQNNNPIDAVWEWHFSFSTHWGTHAVSALKAMHYYQTNL